MCLCLAGCPREARGPENVAGPQEKPRQSRGQEAWQWQWQWQFRRSFRCGASCSITVRTSPFDYPRRTDLANGKSTSHYTGLNNPAGPLPCGAQYRSMNPSGGHAAMPPITSGRMPHLSYTYAGHPQSLSYQSTASYGPVQALHPYRLPTSSNKPAVSGSRTPHKAKSGSSVAEFASRTGNDSTTILLSGLPSSQSEAELRSLLRCYGAVIYLEIPPESRNPGKCKGTARVRYETLSEALKAVRALDGASLSNRKICVKQIRDGAAVSSSSPPPSSSTPSSARHDAKRTVVETKKVSVSAPPLREHNSSQAAHNIPLSSSAPPKLSSTQRASSARNRGSTGNAATSPIGPLVVNGATYSRRLSQGNSDASDDSSEEDSVQSEEGSSDHEQEEEEHGTNAPGKFIYVPSVHNSSSAHAQFMSISRFCTSSSWSRSCRGSIRILGLFWSG